MVKGWFKQNKDLLTITVIIGIIPSLIMIIIGIRVLTENFSFDYLIISLIGILFFPSFIIFAYILINKTTVPLIGYEFKCIKNFDLNNSKELIENILTSKQLIYQKLGPKKVNRFLKFDEVFKVNNDFFIKIDSPYKEGRNKLLYPDSFKVSTINIGVITYNNLSTITEIQKEISLAVEKE
jgi:hypothetical protein